MCGLSLPLSLFLSDPYKHKLLCTLHDLMSQLSKLNTAPLDFLSQTAENVDEHDKKTGNIEDPFDALGRPVLFLFEKSRYLTLSHGNLSRGIFHKLLVLMWTNGRQPSRAQQTCSNRSARETGMLPAFSRKKRGRTPQRS